MDIVTLTLAKKYIKEAGGGGGSLPAGVIVMWSGAVNAIPEGWALCDGTHGTPDLRGRFVLGNSASHAIGSKGGNETVTLTQKQIPTHNHDVYGSSGTITNSASEYINAAIINAGSVSKRGYTATSLVGNNEAHNNMPPYYTLAYIMKL